MLECLECVQEPCKAGLACKDFKLHCRQLLLLAWPPDHQKPEAVNLRTEMIKVWRVLNYRTDSLLPMPQASQAPASASSMDTFLAEDPTRAWPWQRSTRRNGAPAQHLFLKSRASAILGSTGSDRILSFRIGAT